MLHQTMSLIGGAGFGAGMMYFLDPDRGRRRRALVRDKSIRWSRKTRELAGSTSRDVQNRAKGMEAAVKSWVQPEPPVSDHVLAERLDVGARRALGRKLAEPDLGHAAQRRLRHELVVLHHLAVILHRLVLRSGRHDEQRQRERADERLDRFHSCSSQRSRSGSCEPDDPGANHGPLEKR